MFAILILEREPLRWNELWSSLQGWTQDAGGFAAIALVIWCLAYLVQGRQGRSTGFGLQAILFVAALAGSFISYALFFGLVSIQGTDPDLRLLPNGKSIETWKFKDQQVLLLTLGGAFALLAVLIPVLFSLGRLSWRRIWAVAKLSIKETIRHRVLWVFSALVLVVLFASWFLDTENHQYQLRNYVWVLDTSMTLLLLLAASLLAAFSIPGDIKSQTIHTVVTKPIERFELVLGRIVGYSLLMSVVLLAVTSLGLLYLVRSIHPQAMAENYKARVPVYGTLGFKGTEGEDVGREWTHRKYISGPNRQTAQSPHYAIWSFQEIPKGLADRPEGVACEFSLDVFRTRKGEEGKGVFCSFLFVTNRCKLVTRSNGKVEPDNIAAINKRRDDLKQKQTDPAKINNILAEEFGYYLVPSLGVTDYHTQVIRVPTGLFKNLEKEDQDDEGSTDTEFDNSPIKILLSVHQEVLSAKAQLIGVAKYDLYLLDDEKSFEENFFKGALGLWFRLCLIITVAVACSTYLSGIISWICVMVLFGLGLFKNDIQQMVLGASDGGGPIESMIRLANRQSMAGELEKTPTVQVGLWGDEAYRQVMGLVLKLIPDINRFDLSKYVANGFDISWGGVLILDNLLPMLAYIVPWIVLGFYLMKYREVANPT